MIYRVNPGITPFLPLPPSPPPRCGQGRSRSLIGCTGQHRGSGLAHPYPLLLLPYP